MITNKRRIWPYFVLGLLAVGIVGLVYMTFFQKVKVEEAGHWQVNLARTDDSSEVMYERNSRLSLSYRFSDHPYQIDIPEGSYQKVGNGVVTDLGAGLYLYISEYKGDTDSGVSKVLSDFSEFYMDQYNRAGSRAQVLQEESGFINHIAVSFGQGNLTLEGAVTKTPSIFLYDFQGEKQTGCVAACITENSKKELQDYGVQLLQDMAQTVRENPEFIKPDYENNSPSQIASDETQEVEIVLLDPEPDEVPDKKESDEKQTAQIEQQKEPEEDRKMQSQEVKEPEKTVEEPLPEKAPEIVQSDSAVETVNDPADISIQNFTPPLTGYPMSVTVSVGKASENAQFSITAPDGEMFGPVKAAGTVATFQIPCAVNGTYSVTVTHFSEVQSVHIKLHCG